MFIDVHLLCDIYSLFSIDLFIFYYHTVGCSTLFRSQLVQYISKTKKLERALRVKDVLCSALAEKLDVMKDEKTSRSIGRTNMNNSKTNGGDCSQLKDECNGCSCSHDQTAEPSRNQTRNFQNEGTKDKSDQSVANGCVVLFKWWASGFWRPSLRTWKKKWVKLQRKWIKFTLRNYK